jgi:hypothetical protein
MRCSGNKGPRRGRHEDYPIGEKHGLPDVVGDEHEGVASLGPNPLEFALEDLSGLGVERRERFVGQEHFRLAGQRPGQGGALAHPP